ncbi:MAG: hypothetical protein JSS11_17280, partial [Verrucomicrobia bacterium]|nr:hypothetical protein [Verrucomicrobiota bacterium]
MRTTPSPLSAYQRSARSLSAKSVAPLVAAALTAASTAHAEIHVYTPATNNVVGNPGTVFIDFFTGGIGAIGSVPHGQFVLNVDNDGYYDSLRSKIYAFSRGAAINSYIHLHGYADQSDDIAANFAPGTPLGADSFTGSADFNGRTSL